MTVKEDQEMQAHAARLRQEQAAEVARLQNITVEEAATRMRKGFGTESAEHKAEKAADGHAG